MQFEVEYGLEVPVAPNVRGDQTALEFFKRSVPVLGNGVSFDTATGTPINKAITQYASTTPLYWLPIVSTATSSQLINLPTFLAPRMRINASMIGSNGAFWIAPVLKDSVR